MTEIPDIISQTKALGLGKLGTASYDALECVW